MLKKEKVKAAVVLIAAAALVLILSFIDPTKYTYYPPCYFKAITGYLCPGCGGIRGIHLLLNGHFLEAIKHNILIFIFIPIIAYYLLTKVALLFFGKNLPPFNPPLIIVILLIVIIILYTILRNLPYFPFKMLNP